MSTSKRVVSSLPEELIQEVFTRLPKKSLLRFRSISKGIRNLIDSSLFKNCYDMYHNSVSDFVVMLVEAKRLFSMDFNLPDNNVNFSQEKEICYPLDESIIFIGCSEGIVCLTSLYTQPGRYVLLNPFNGTFEILEHKSNFVPNSFKNEALGYDPATDDYKIVKWESHPNSNVQYIDVYSLRKDSWGRVVLEFNSGFSDGFFHHRNGVCVEGVIHWLWGNLKGDNCIAAFDLKTEKLRSLKIPPKVDEKKRYLSLLDFGGRLYVNIESPDRKSRIFWVMEQYGDDNSWTPLFNIVNKVEVIGYFPTWDNTRLLCFESDSILWFWLKDDGSIENIQIRKLPRFDDPYYRQLPPQSWVCVKSVKSPVRLRCSLVQND